jgi:hypothetical protein
MAKSNKRMKLKLAPGSEAKQPVIELLNLRPPTRRFIGWNLVTVNVDNQVRFGYEPKTEPDDVAYHWDYVQAVRNGELVPADQETADLCGVAFQK